MALGTVKWFNNQKGYGFLCPEDSQEEVFIHFSSINMPGYKTLRAGQKVSFELESGSKGLHALNIQEAESLGTNKTPSAEPTNERVNS
jgi:cold shock protein